MYIYIYIYLHMFTYISQPFSGPFADVLPFSQALKVWSQEFLT